MVALAAFSAVVVGATLWPLNVPYGHYIGGVIGAVLSFLAISYWYYGR